MAYATTQEVAAGFRELDADDKARCEALLNEAAMMIDALAQAAKNDAKKIVSIRMVRRALGEGDSDITYPMGATQGSMSAGGYTQSWTISNGQGQLYFEKLDKTLLGMGNRIGASNPYGGDGA